MLRGELTSTVVVSETRDEIIISPKARSTFFSPRDHMPTRPLKFLSPAQIEPARISVSKRNNIR